MYQYRKTDIWPKIQKKTKRPMIKIETISRHMAKNIEKDKTTND